MERERMYIWELVAEYVKNARSRGVTRRDVMFEMTVNKCTAIYHLERARKAGAIYRVWAVTERNQHGWVYYGCGTFERAGMLEVQSANNIS